jgi:16S rRNA (cytosine1402-N4)-methyltransferase
MTDAPHTPVLLAEVLEALAPAPGRLIVDGTFGAGGYSRAFVAAGAEVLAFDRDPTARAYAAGLEAPGRLRLLEDRFSSMSATLPPHSADGVALDLGVSSMQLDEAERGFSLMRDGPLDMRMGGSGPAAADLVERTLGGRRGAKIHPATRVFQALRIAVNAELEELELGLTAAEQVLKAGGRLAVVTFHSLEDRIVKSFLAERSGRNRGVSRHAPPAVEGPAPSFELLFNGHRGASPAETAANPRARSAKLRAAIRTAAPTWRVAA